MGFSVLEGTFTRFENQVTELPVGTRTDVRLTYMTRRPDNRPENQD